MALAARPGQIIILLQVLGLFLSLLNGLEAKWRRECMDVMMRCDHKGPPGRPAAFRSLCIVSLSVCVAVGRGGTYSGHGGSVWNV